MPPLPQAIILVLSPFAPLVSRRVWRHALPLRGHGDRRAERAEEDVDDPARGLDVAGRDRRGRPRVDEAALRGAHRHRRLAGDGSGHGAPLHP